VPRASFSRLAVVRSTDVKHVGRSQGLVAANVKAQIAMQIALESQSNSIGDCVRGITFHNYKNDDCLPAFSFIEAHGTGMRLLFFVGTNADAWIKVPLLAISLRLKGSAKFSSLLLAQFLFFLYNKGRVEGFNHWEWKSRSSPVHRHLAERWRDTHLDKMRVEPGDVMAVF
jgi:hypothetical protein